MSFVNKGRLFISKIHVDPDRLMIVGLTQPHKLSHAEKNFQVHIND